MIIVDTILGNLGDSSWRERLDGVVVDYLTLDQWEAQKNRLRKRTIGNLEIAVALARSAHLRDGDILLFDAAARTAVAARIELNDVMVIDVDPILAMDPETVLRICFELGHALGNQHWPAIVKKTRIYVPLTVDAKVMSSVMRTHAFPGIMHSFVPGQDVIPYLAPHEARRLFGGAEQESQSHPFHNHHDGP
jgi:urease accessory protein